MSNKFFITRNQQEQAERMAEKWMARAEAFWTGGEGWGFGTADFCKTADDANRAEENAEKIHLAINRLTSGCGNWPDVQIIRTAVAGRDELDAGVAMMQEANRG